MFKIKSLNYVFKTYNRNSRKQYEKCSELTKTPVEQFQSRRSGVFIVSFEHVSHLFCGAFAVDFEHLFIHLFYYYYYYYYYYYHYYYYYFQGEGVDSFLVIYKIFEHFMSILFQLLPDKYKIENNESSQKKIEDAKKVAAAGLEGKSKGIFTRERILEANAAV